MKFARYSLLLFLAAALGGCASLGRGIVEAVLEAQNRESEDTRACAVEGVAFTGMAPMLERQSGFGPLSPDNATRPSLKVVYVHGISEQLPGHGANLVRSLADALGLSVRAGRVKRIVLAPPDGSARPYGEVNITRRTDSARARELLFFEHTWSEITQRERDSIKFDNSEIFRSQRAAINQRIREFSNSALPDPIAFAGVRGPDIIGLIGKAICWALSARWHDLPELTTGVRCQNSGLYGARVAIDDLDISTVTPYDVTQLWSMALHRHPQNVDGLLYMSRHLNDQKAAVIFDRTRGKLGSPCYTLLSDAEGALKALLEVRISIKFA